MAKKNDLENKDYTLPYDKSDDNKSDDDKLDYDQPYVNDSEEISQEDQKNRNPDAVARFTGKADSTVDRPESSVLVNNSGDPLVQSIVGQGPASKVLGNNYNSKLPAEDLDAIETNEYPDSNLKADQDKSLKGLKIPEDDKKAINSYSKYEELLKTLKDLKSDDTEEPNTVTDNSTSDGTSIPQQDTSNDINSLIQSKQGNVSSELQSKQSLLDQYKALVQQRQDSNQGLGVLQGANQVAQAIASGYGAKIGDGSEAINQLRKDNELPIQSLLGQGKASDLQSEINSNDPDSSISQFARKQAINILKRQDPNMTPQMVSEIEKQVSGMTAKEIEGLTKGNSSILKGGIATPRPYQLIKGQTTNDGHPIAIDPNTRLVYDTITGKQLDPNAKLINLTPKVNPVTGQIEYMSTTGSQGINNDNSGKVTVDEETGKSLFKPTKEQRGSLDKNAKLFDKQIVIPMQQIRDADSLSDELASNGKLDMLAIQERMAKITKGAGALTNQDEVRFSGSKALIDRINQAIQSAKDSTLTPENRKQFSILLKTFLAQSNQAFVDTQEKFANRMEADGIPNQFTKDYLGKMPTTPNLENGQVPTSLVEKGKAPEKTTAQPISQSNEIPDNKNTGFPRQVISADGKHRATVSNQQELDAAAKKGFQ